MHHTYVKYLKDKFTGIKKAARATTRKAIRTGAIVPPFEGAIPHHPNYGLPLQVIWCSKEEHAQLHKSIKAQPYWQLLAMAGVPYLSEEEFHEQNGTFRTRPARSSRYEGHHFQGRGRQTRFLAVSA